MFFTFLDFGEQKVRELSNKFSLLFSSETKKVEYQLFSSVLVSDCGQIIQTEVAIFLLYRAKKVAMILFSKLKRQTKLVPNTKTLEKSHLAAIGQNLMELKMDALFNKEKMSQF